MSVNQSCSKVHTEEGASRSRPAPLFAHKMIFSPSLNLCFAAWALEMSATPTNSANNQLRRTAMVV